MKRVISFVVFDMDGVLVDVASSWSYVHNAFNVGKNDNLSSYLKGEIDFRELMRRDIRLWGRAHINDIERILSHIPIMKGARQAILGLQKAGCKTAIISAGISVLADRLQKTLGIDYSLANVLATDENGLLTGEGKEVVPLLEKAEVLRHFASENRTALEDFAAVGDSKYDIPLFDEVGLSIAFNSEDNQVREKADVVIAGKDLSRIVPYILKRNVDRSD